MSADNQIIQKVMDILSEQKLGVMATYEPQQPYLSLVAFCHTPDLKKIVVATDRNTRKYENIMKNSRAAILFDNRSVAESDFRAGIAVTAYGTVEEAKEPEISRLRQYYLEKHPFMEDFLLAASTAMLCLKVEYYQIVDNFQNVTVAAMSSLA
ncbi:MAG: pyridoxamine 5'-phosphate oxidase family protein [Desulfomonilaceae bacterium]